MALTPTATPKESSTIKEETGAPREMAVRALEPMRPTKTLSTMLYREDTSTEKIIGSASFISSRPSGIVPMMFSDSIFFSIRMLSL